MKSYSESKKRKHDLKQRIQSVALCFRGRRLIMDISYHKEISISARMQMHPKAAGNLTPASPTEIKSIIILCRHSLFWFISLYLKQL